MFPPDFKFNRPLTEDELEQLSQEEFIQYNAWYERKQQAWHVESRPLFETFFRRAVAEEDAVLKDFARSVVGPLSDLFASKSAKGGAFFEERVAEGKNADRYAADQTLRAHLINGMLPARRIAHTFRRWGAERLVDYWDEQAERLFIAGYMLHDYTKIDAVKTTLRASGFRDGESPSERQIPVLIELFQEWGEKLGLNEFLQPVGGLEALTRDLIYVAHNTQRRSGTIHAGALLGRLNTPLDTHELARDMSWLADLLAYIARTPRAVVTSKEFTKPLYAISRHSDSPTGLVGRLVYHHVAENRGLLLNLIHDSAMEAMVAPNVREPLLYAPSGVVYLERYDAEQAAPLPRAGNVIPRIVVSIRERAGEQLLKTGKGAKRGNVNIQLDESYNDYFDLREFVAVSWKFARQFVSSKTANKAPARLAYVTDGHWPGWDNLPAFSERPEDARLDQVAEWAALLEVSFRDRLPEFNIFGWLLNALQIGDLSTQFYSLRDYPDARKGGVKYWWFWAAAHVLNRQVLDDIDTLSLLERLSGELATALPDPLPLTAQANEDTWTDLANYLARVFTINTSVTAAGQDARAIAQHEVARYTRTKAARGAAACAICGGDYHTREPSETAIAFQPGVFTQRLKIGSSSNARPLCSICALEQLLRQMFIHGQENGSSAENQRIRYLSFYPSYFFTPETLRFMKSAYHELAAQRLNDRELRNALNTEALAGDENQPPYLDVRFWQRLEQFFASDANVERRFDPVLRFGSEAQSTFFMVGLRNIDPTETESWIMPTFLALFMSITLDVKVVATASETPLMLEADELNESVWLDGAHPAISALVADVRGEGEAPSLSLPGRIRIDRVLPALARLTAAYLIHMDTEAEPPKANWHRFGPIAHSLMESPLYVFHHLKRQQRDSAQPLGFDRVRRYVRFANQLFAPASPQGEQWMSLARKLVEEYRGFYRARSIKNANSILRPLNVVADALLNADPHLFQDDEARIEVAYGELYRFMDRVGKGLADGRFPKGITAVAREEAMRTFCHTFVDEVFAKAFRHDVAALRGKQLNLLRSACEMLYRDAQRREWEQAGVNADIAEAAEDSEEIADPTIESLPE